MAIIQILKKETCYESESDWETAVDLEIFYVEMHRVWFVINDMPLAVEVVLTSIKKFSYVEDEISGGFDPQMKLDGHEHLLPRGFLYFSDLCFEKTISDLDEGTILGNYIFEYFLQMSVHDMASIFLENEFYFFLMKERNRYEADAYIYNIYQDFPC